MIGCTVQTLLEWVKRDEVDCGMRNGVSIDERERIRALEQEVKELPRANEIVKVTKAYSPRRSSTADSNPESFRRAVPQYIRG